MIRIRIVFLSIVFLLGGIGGTSWAGTIYAVDDEGNSLISIDTVTLAITNIGSTNITSGNFGDLAYDEITQTMYYAGGRNDNNLYTLDLNTGAATLVGPHGIGDLFTLGYDGTNLYGQSLSGSVYQINKNTAAALLIGSNGVYPGGYDWNSLTNQMIYLGAGVSGSINEVNLSNGSITQLASLGFVNDSDIAYDPDLDAYWTIDWDGNLYQYDNAFNRSTLLTNINVSAAIEYVGDPDPVPEPATIALLGIGLAGLAGAEVRRRRKKKAVD